MGRWRYSTQYINSKFIKVGYRNSNHKILNHSGVIIKMWKILLSSVSFFAICASAFAVNECAYKGYVNMSSLNPAQYSVTTSHATNSTEWTYTLKKGDLNTTPTTVVGVFYAVGLCSFSESGDSPATSLKSGNNIGNFTGVNCWCRMVSPFRSKWIYVSTHTDSTDACANNCSCSTDWGGTLWNAYFNNIIPD